jgi:hypothetical protein
MSEALAAVSLLLAVFMMSEVLDRADSTACLMEFIVTIGEGSPYKSYNRNLMSQAHRVGTSLIEGPVCFFNDR